MSNMKAEGMIVPGNDIMASEGEGDDGGGENEVMVMIMAV